MRTFQPPFTLHSVLALLLLGWSSAGCDSTRPKEVPGATLSDESPTPVLRKPSTTPSTPRERAYGLVPVTRGKRPAPAVGKDTRFPQRVTVPVLFEENVGQGPKKFRFVARGPGYVAGFDPTGMSMLVGSVGDLPSVASSGDPAEGGATPVRISFTKDRGGSLVGLKRSRVRVRQHAGEDAESRFSSIPVFGELEYTSSDREPSFQVSGNDGRISYSVTVPRGFDLRQLRFTVEGAKEMRLDRHGNLVMLTEHGPVVQTRPKFLERSGTRAEQIPGDFVLLSETEFGFQARGRSPDTTLLIDPTVVFSSYTPGSVYADVAIGGNGIVYVSGAGPPLDALEGGPGDYGMHAYVWAVDPNTSEEVYRQWWGVPGSGDDATMGEGIAASFSPDGVVYVAFVSNTPELFALSAPAGEPVGQDYGYLTFLKDGGSLAAVVELGPIPTYGSWGRRLVAPSSIRARGHGRRYRWRCLRSRRRQQVREQRKCSRDAGCIPGDARGRNHLRREVQSRPVEQNLFHLRRRKCSRTHFRPVRSHGPRLRRRNDPFSGLPDDRGCTTKLPANRYHKR